MNKTAFISRKVGAESPFRETLQSQGWQVFHASLVDFSGLTFDRIPSSDWIFFYSRQAVQFFFKGLSQNLIITPPVKIGAMGPGTAEALNAFNCQVDFTGTGDPVVTANDFLAVAAGQIVLFPQAEQSRQSLSKLIGAEIKAIEFPVYKNMPRTDFDLPEVSYYALTSPLNAQVFLQLAKSTENHRVVVIGKTTAAALWNGGYSSPVLIAEKSTEAALATAILQDYQIHEK